MKRILADAQATERLAVELLNALPASVVGWTVLLSGELGAGKSTFARAFIHAAGHDGTVPSPTYTLVEPYTTPRGLIYHIDLYRISDEQELRYLGWSEMDDGCRLVEWPERSPNLQQAADLCLTLGYAGAARSAELTAITERGRLLLPDLRSLDLED
jgi:tRNA threonylcarbamoyladenosine biosynthesis protein TsaE